MADPLSITSGVLTLVVVALKSSKLLYETVRSFQSNSRSVRELKEELESLGIVLESLQESLKNPDIDLHALERPLTRCSKACHDFQELIETNTKRSGGPKSSFRDWAKLKYLGEDIVGFKNMLAAYKSTITIALGDINIRTSTITLSVLNEYKLLIADTSEDLKEHFQQIDDRLRSLSLAERESQSQDVRTEVFQIQEEKESTQKCLEICEDVMRYIDKVQSSSSNTPTTPSNRHSANREALYGDLSAQKTTSDAFQLCKEQLSETSVHLEKHLQDVVTRLEKESSSSGVPRYEHAPEMAKIKEEMESIRKCLQICTEASTKADKERVNVFEDISAADDGHQILVSTFGDLISAKRVTAGVRSNQWMGQMSDESLQHLSAQNNRSVRQNLVEPVIEKGTHFEGRYGAGLRLFNSSEGVEMPTR